MFIRDVAFSACEGKEIYKIHSIIWRGSIGVGNHIPPTYRSERFDERARTESNCLENIVASSFWAMTRNIYI